MQAYLRPETLFSPKFEGYLNEVVSNEKVLISQGAISEKTGKTISSLVEWANS